MEIKNPLLRSARERNTRVQDGGRAWPLTQDVTPKLRNKRRERELKDELFEYVFKKSN